MLNTRAIQSLIAALIVLGMHMCCCQVMPISVGGACGQGGRGGDRGHQCDGHAADHHDHGHDHGGGQPGHVPSEGPEGPQQPAHDCCGVHAKASTAQVWRFELPAVTWIAILPPHRLEPATLPVSMAITVAGAGGQPPAPDTTLLRRHCALIV